jgi:hypothetical protein
MNAQDWHIECDAAVFERFSKPCLRRFAEWAPRIPQIEPPMPSLSLESVSSTFKSRLFGDWKLTSAVRRRFDRLVYGVSHALGRNKPSARGQTQIPSTPETVEVLQ